MPPVLALHAHKTFFNLLSVHFAKQTSLINLIDMDKGFSLDSDDEKKETSLKDSRLIIFDREAWQNHKDTILTLKKNCYLTPHLLCLGDIADDHHDLTLKRPFKFGKFLDIVERLLSPSLDNVPETQIPCEPYGYIDVAARSWHAANGDVIPITDKEIILLYTLSTTQCGPVSKKTLYNAVWGYQDELETHTLETHIYRLRQKIEPDSNNPKIIKTYEDSYALINYEN